MGQAFNLLGLPSPKAGSGLHELTCFPAQKTGFLKGAF